jgi:hypothetical protein
MVIVADFSQERGWQDPETIRKILRDFRKIAVVGLSPKPHRPSHRISVYMQAAGYEIIPVNPGQDELLGEKCHPNLAALPDPPEVVNIFRRSEYAADAVEQAISAGAKAVWLQVGVIDEEAARRAREAGLAVVMDL